MLDNDAGLELIALQKDLQSIEEQLNAWTLRVYLLSKRYGVSVHDVYLRYHTLAYADIKKALRNPSL